MGQENRRKCEWLLLALKLYAQVVTRPIRSVPPSYQARVLFA